MSSLKKFDYRIKDNRKRNMFLCGIILVVVAIIGVKLFNSYASFSNETNELTMVNAKTKVYPTAVAKITELEKTNTNSELRYDGTTDNNLRYIGKNPHNYVKFNDELWRIIGVMNNVEDEVGNKNTRVKLIKSKDIGQISWDNVCINNDFSVDDCTVGEISINNWSNATLQKLLNGPYLNSTVSTEYNRWSETYSNKRYEKIDFTKTGIKAEYRDMIDIVKYKLGSPDYGNSQENYYGNLTSNIFYNIERSNNVYPGNPKEWIGKIGLMYPSDYGYATAGGLGIDTFTEKTYNNDLETCLSTPIYNWGQYNMQEYVGCRDNDWLYTSIIDQWTITPILSSFDYALLISDGGPVNYISVDDSYLIRPVLYLKPTVKITGGIGTEDNPFTLSI